VTAESSFDGSQCGRRPNGRLRPVSEVLADFSKTTTSERISLRDIVDALADRGYGLLLLLFALPNCIPIYLPGLSAVFGLPLGVIAAQMIIGRDSPWLPKALLDRSISHADYDRLMGRATPYLAKLERVMKPRLLALASDTAQRGIGLLCLCQAILLPLPIPLTNIPLAIPVVFLGLGLVARDGLLALIGAVGAVASTTLTVVFGWAVLKAIASFLAAQLA